MSKQEEVNLTKGGLCVEITDPKEIAELDKQTPYISKMEDANTLDQNLLNTDAYNKSVQMIGQHRPIEIAVWHEDPNKDSPDSPFRIHMRIINGRHRYLQDQNWRRKYYKMTSQDKVLGYFQLRQHFDLQKKSTPEERTVMIDQMCMYINKEQGLPPQECCNKICEMLVPQGVASESTIRKACPDKYKDQGKSDAKKGKTFEKIGKDTKAIKQVKEKIKADTTKLQAELHTTRTELDESLRENAGLHKELTKINSEFEEVQSKLRIVSQLEDTVEIDNIKIHVKIDATNNKLIIEKI